MPGATNHIIHKLNVEAQVNTVKAAKELEKNITAFINNELLDLLERLLEKAFSSDFVAANHLRIDELHIHLSARDLTSVATLQFELKKQITAQLFHMVKEDKDANILTSQFDEAFTVTPHLPKAPAKPARVITHEQSILDLFYYFLEHGSLPWWAPAKATTFNETTLAEAISKNEGGFEQQFRKFIISQPSIRRRLVMQFSPSLLSLFAGFIMPLQQYQTVVNAYAQLASVNLIYTSEQELRFVFWLTVFEQASKPITGVGEVTDYHAPEAIDTPRYSEAFTLVATLLSPSFNNQQLVRATDERIVPPIAGKDSPVSIGEIKKETPALKEESNAAESFVSNAGLILIHPFITPLFQEVGLISEGTFADDDARQTAVHILHYLATANVAAYEYQMVFEKYLCGFPAGETLHRFIELSSHIKAECNKLLVAVIAHWGSLKSTSPDGLRQSFLQRNGKLDTGSTFHRLIVEKQTPDILLDRLPWGISMVKLPWMKNILHVQWNNPVY